MVFNLKDWRVKLFPLQCLRVLPWQEKPLHFWGSQLLYRGWPSLFKALFQVRKTEPEVAVVHLVFREFFVITALVMRESLAPCLRAVGVCRQTPFPGSDVASRKWCHTPTREPDRGTDHMYMGTVCAPGIGGTKLMGNPAPDCGKPCSSDGGVRLY